MALVDSNFETEIVFYASIIAKKYLSLLYSILFLSNTEMLGIFRKIYTARKNFSPIFVHMTPNIAKHNYFSTPVDIITCNIPCKKGLNTFKQSKKNVI